MAWRSLAHIFAWAARRFAGSCRRRGCRRSRNVRRRGTPSYRRTGAQSRARISLPPRCLLSEPIKIVQAPDLTIILYEAGNLHRQIFTDGRALPKEVAFPAFLGYSVGRWDHDTFVVETAGFNDKTPLDGIGHPHSEALRVTERFHRRDFGHLDLEMTFEDPEMYAKPFTVHIPHDLVADNDIFEMFCENEKDRAHLKSR
jgi:hypothetical protein